MRKGERVLITAECDRRVSWLENQNGRRVLTGIEVYTTAESIQVRGIGERKPLRGGLCLDRAAFLSVMADFIREGMSGAEIADLLAAVSPRTPGTPGDPS
jgi:hypothetical protein